MRFTYADEGGGFEGYWISSLWSCWYAPGLRVWNDDVALPSLLWLCRCCSRVWSNNESRDVGFPVGAALGVTATKDFLEPLEPIEGVNDGPDDIVQAGRACYCYPCFVCG